MANDLLLKNSSQRNHVKIDSLGVLRIESREYVTKTEADFYPAKGCQLGSFHPN